jgi:hypothetical protein
MALILPTIGLAGALGLAGCGVGTAGAGSPGGLAGAGNDLADEATALAQVGFDTGLEDTPTPSASAGAPSEAGAPSKAGAQSKVGAQSKAGDRRTRRKAIRKYLRGNTLHGEVTVRAKDGTKTIVVQRGSVTAVSGSSLTVKSTDGYTLTWTLADKATIVQDKKKVETSALKTGEQIGVAGTKDGSADDARLIAIK